MVEIINQEALHCGEGPVWDGRTQRLFWTDAMAPGIYSYDRQSGKSEVVSRAKQASCLAPRMAGGLVLATREGFFRWDERGVESIEHHGEITPPHSLNEVIADPAGRLFAGQEVYKEGEAYDTGYLFRLDMDGSLAIVEEGLHIGNGMGFSPEMKTFYLVDSVLRQVYAYDYDRASGAIKNRRTLITLRPDDGLPDGMTVDAEGFLWIARWFGSAVSRHDPEGKLERTISLPVAQISSVMFGGKDLDELYVTSAAVHWESKLAPAGHDYSAARGGALFRIRPGVQGKPEFLAAL